MRCLALILLAMAAPSCAPIAAYNATVAARSDSLSGYTKDGASGAAWIHRVEYR